MGATGQPLGVNRHPDARPVANAPRAVQVAVTGASSCAQTRDGALWCWGWLRGSDGRLAW
jgi:hypothetical protein